MKDDKRLLTAEEAIGLLPKRRKWIKVWADGLLWESELLRTAVVERFGDTDVCFELSREMKGKFIVMLKDDKKLFIEHCPKALARL